MLDFCRRKALPGALPLIVAVLHACSTMPSAPPSSREIDNRPGQSKSLVLLGLQAIEDKDEGLIENFHEHVHVSVAKEPEGHFEGVPVAPIASEDKGRVWTYLVLAPGSYHLRIAPPETNLGNYTFRLDVPENWAVYAGTLRATCWGDGGGRPRTLYRCADDTVLITDTGAPEAILGYQNGAVATSWLEPVASDVRTAESLTMPQERSVDLASTGILDDGSVTRGIIACIVMGPLCPYYFGAEAFRCGIASAVWYVLDEDVSSNVTAKCF